MVNGQSCTNPSEQGIPGVVAEIQRPLSEPRVFQNQMPLDPDAQTRIPFYR